MVIPLEKKKKSDFHACFLKFQTMVENQFDHHIKKFRSDGGGEFQSHIFLKHLAVWNSTSNFMSSDS